MNKPKKSIKDLSICKKIKAYFNIPKIKQLTIKDCKCTLIGRKFTRCKFHQECIGTPCASGINICDNPKHQENKL